MKHTLVAGALSLGMLSGCASINGSFQRVDVKTTDGGAPVSSATCQLHNHEGTWRLITPGSVTIKRSASALVVQCAQRGIISPAMAVRPRVKGWTYVDAAIFPPAMAMDIIDGAGYYYPDLITAELGTAKTQPAAAYGVPTQDTELPGGASPAVGAPK